MPSSRRRTRSSDAISPNLTPLLDIVLQLITFFMMLVHFGTRLEGADRGVRLPVAPAALPGSDLTIDRLPVSLDRRGGLRVGDRSLDAAEAAAWWDEQARARRSGLELLQGGGASSGLGSDELPTVVILRADRDASYGAVRRTLAEAQERGFAQFSLVVLRREPR
ncbi:Biopolymer transport protein ExbD/TolR [Aquisphaera giovannonii]|uniref:Biopolymer transport protein ExbD/TolR n=1 Tax=Aquisphaera giovannonii TaxID=406548 RepID=A0A5B9W507_9BACT|nr:biopolymer transporter ExbD [Aquisphaera giovannonii]QEH35682.1 Biopolymer transport protein ExbD/TolR [Aquisphaera giovannonii]